MDTDVFLLVTNFHNYTPEKGYVAISPIVFWLLQRELWAKGGGEGPYNIEIQPGLWRQLSFTCKSSARTESHVHHPVYKL